MNPTSRRFRIAQRFIPELALARTPDERDEAYALTHFIPVILSHALFLIVFASLSVSAVLNRLAAGIPFSEAGPDVFAVVFFGVFVYVACKTPRYKSIQVRQYLLLHGVPLCGHCGQDLANIQPDAQTVAKCPRCEQAFDPDFTKGVACDPFKSSSVLYRLTRFFVPELNLARSDGERGILLQQFNIGLVTGLWLMLIVLTIHVTLYTVYFTTPGPFAMTDWPSFIAPSIFAITFATLIPLNIHQARRAARDILTRRGVPL